MSRTVAILPTGLTEWKGLPGALERLFPSHHFCSMPSEQEVASERVAFPYAGFTSSRLGENSEGMPPEKACDLVERAAQAALGDRQRKRAAADLVLIVEDVELHNADQPNRIVSVMRKAVEQHLASLPSAGGVSERTRAALRDRVSFHLIAPMIEAWLFADAQSLAAAGVPAGTSIDFGPQTDPEAFCTADQPYLEAVEADCPTLAALPKEKRDKLRPKWLGTLPRARHPKGYLQWLCRAPAERSCTTYSESRDGAWALAGIRWESLLARAPEHFAFLRALIEDLEDALGCQRAVGALGGAVSPLTARSGAPRNAVLRNL